MNNPTNNIFSLTVDQDWTYFDLKKGTILKFLDKNYEKDKQRTIYVFKIIGEPVKDELQEIKVEFI